MLPVEGVLGQVDAVLQHAEPVDESGRDFDAAVLALRVLGLDVLHPFVVVNA